jgi:hypothetical protein
MQQIGDSKMVDDGAHTAVVLPFRDRDTAHELTHGTRAPRDERAVPAEKRWRPIRDVAQGLVILAGTMLLIEAARQLLSGG